MTLSQLLSDVVEITKRPDARARSLLALNTILSEILTDYDYPEDLIEETVPYAATSGQIVIPSPTEYPIRSIVWLQIKGQLMTQTTPREISQLKGCTPMNVFYRSGRSLIINTSWDNFSEFRIGYYPTPAHLSEIEGSDTHWLLDAYPSMLLNGTIARTFQATGDEESAAYYESLYLRLRGQIRRSQLED